ncbi:hypothetical protein, partial [Frankia sp. AvcI1]
LVAAACHYIALMFAIR